MKIKLTPLINCKRCKYEWRPRKEVVRICPKCKSVHWDKVRKVKK